jgi:hypothetical protein
MSNGQSANEEWREKVEQYVSGEATGRKMTRAQAVSALAKDEPDLRERVVDEANADRPRRQ